MEYCCHVWDDAPNIATCVWIKYSRVDQVQLVEDSLYKIWRDMADHIPLNFLKAVSHKFTWSTFE